VVRLVPAAPNSNALRFDPLSWPGRKAMLIAEGSVHMIITLPVGEIRLWLPGPEPPPVGTPLAAALDLDAQVAERSAAAERFWRMVAGLPPRSSLQQVVPQPQRHGMMLWGLDLRAAGQSQRAIARTMLNVGELSDWADAAERSNVRRVLRDANRLVSGGYLHLLRPTKRQVPLAR
jgi:hypothetical protein